ncbi:hypothetical protein ROE7235_00397 [Roseibaca ekhonensis]|uniref:DUF306 domain-containing protein n=1 Tax=Roseinatronobacter ekhonensis TaxID=254356 RepID=A0A3B0M3D7_9RHOB|nr:META domain-containing protein [Roseibaca ekhonensis]SUZ30671.1 hypothetical protein ROE7235_00397 [Roseibaca ekhonensis]
MRVIAIACVVAALGQGALARDVALVLDWPAAEAGTELGAVGGQGTPPSAELVAVTRDSAGAVLTTLRQPVSVGTPEVTLSLPSLSRQATTLHVGALVAGRFRLQSARATILGGQPPDSLSLSAVLTASFTTDYLCDTGEEIALVPDGAGFVLDGARDKRFAPSELDGRFTAEDGTIANRIPGLLQLESGEGVLIETCQPIPARPILPLTALGPLEDPAWRVDIGLDGSLLTLPTDAAVTPPDAPAPRVATTITRQSDDALRFEMGVHRLLVRRAPCTLPGVDMPYPLSASLTGPDGAFPMGCAGNPLRSLEGAPWQVTHLFGAAVPPADDGANAFTLQFDTGRVAGRTSCNRYLGRAAVAGARLEVRDLGATRLPCPTNLTNLETRFLDALEAATGILRLPGGGLVLYAGSTAILVAKH